MAETRELALRWTARRGKPSTYIAHTCAHGIRANHNLAGALKCGMLQAVRAARGHSEQVAAEAIGVPVGALRAWEAGTRSPVGPQRAALERYLLRG